MLYIHSKENNIYVNINSKHVNVFAGERFINIRQDKWFQKLTITTSLGSSDLIAYDLDNIGKAIDKIFDFIINCNQDWISSDVPHVVELEDIYDSDK